MNLVSKTNIFDFFWDVSRKTKANDLEKTLVWHYYVQYGTVRTQPRNLHDFSTYMHARMVHKGTRFLPIYFMASTGKRCLIKCPDARKINVLIFLGNFWQNCFIKKCEKYYYQYLKTLEIGVPLFIVTVINIFFKHVAVCEFCLFLNRKSAYSYCNLFPMDAKCFDLGFVTNIVTQTAIERIVQICLANGGV